MWPSAGGLARGIVAAIDRALVELYTSQGCDTCPEAEPLPGVPSGRNTQVVPVAFHVDYFNSLWKDSFLDALYSQRQASYNEVYTAPEHPDYGLYNSPMLMVDGADSANGRDLVGVRAELARAAKSKSHSVLIFGLAIA